MPHFKSLNIYVLKGECSGSAPFQNIQRHSDSTDVHASSQVSKKVLQPNSILCVHVLIEVSPFDPVGAVSKPSSFIFRSPPFRKNTKHHESTGMCSTSQVFRKVLRLRKHFLLYNVLTKCVFVITFFSQGKSLTLSLADMFS